MSDNLLDRQKRVITNAIDSVQPPSKYKCLVMDVDAAKIVAQVLEEHEILDRNVATVEKLEQKRSTQNYIDAMYIIRPTALSIDCMNADFTRVPNRYAAAHVFLLPDPNMADIMRRIKNQRVGGHLRTLQVLYIDHYPLEQCIFSFKQPQSLEIFYNQNCFDLVQNYVAQVAGQLVGICTSFGEYPIVRFYKPDAPLNQTSVLPYMIATAFHQVLDEYARTNPDFPVIDESRPRSVFLITDRTMDVLSPLVHEFTYQAMAYDLLNIVEGNVYKYERQEKGESIKTSGKLTDKDTEWVSLRHLHMQQAIELFTARLEKLKKDHPHLADQSTQASVSDLQDMVAGLPMFAEMKERFSLHLSMAGQCMDLLQKSNLMDVANIEQTCVTGVTADGRKPKTLTDEFVEMIASDEVAQKDKVRLVLLYCLYRGGLVEADLEKLEKHAGLKDIDLEVIRNLTLLEGRVTKPDLSKKTAKKTPKPTTFHSGATGDVYETSRFVPGLKNVVDQLIQGTLPASIFPYTKDEPLDDEVDMSAKASLRNPRQRAAWAKSAQFQAPRQRIFIFVAGGFTMSEARSVYELNEQYNSKSIFLGGNDIVTPGSFLASLSRLRAPRDKLRLKQDEPKKTRAPAFLMEPDGINKPVAPAQASQSSNRAGGPPLPTATSSGMHNMPKPKSVSPAVPDASAVAAALDGSDAPEEEKKKKKSGMKKLKKVGKFFK
ncbi:Protein transport protein [Yarrowia sp. C11]|nr:Protein transport protein [Yarrowia sp. C11]KAG5370525.1 Protein transport protein [Yarrowia sp. E02]